MNELNQPQLETLKSGEFTQFDEFEAKVSALLQKFLYQESATGDVVKDGIVKYLKGQKGLLEALKLPEAEQTPEMISRLVNEQSTRLDPIPDVLQMVDQSGKPVSYPEDAVGLVPSSQVKA